jgi:3-hydroxyisobutyrate dehydrogenase
MNGTVGFIGLGQMGFQMAARLAAAGTSLLVSDTDSERLEQFAKESGARIAADSTAWVDTETLILMLPNSAIVESVLLQTGVADALPQGALVIDMSSSEPMRSRELSQTLAAKGLRYLDAPVSGGVKGASEGTLSIMVGGAQDDLGQAKLLLEHLGSRVFHVGTAGSGHAAKALNNMVSAATIVATVEALNTGTRFGIDPHLLNEVFNSSSSQSNTTENKVEQYMLSSTFASGFALSLMAKDVRIARDLAENLGHDLELGAACEEMWSRIGAEVPPGTDHTAMYHLLNHG